jgi:starch-binding outer membrane protein, SusD/RagB family
MTTFFKKSIRRVTLGALLLAPALTLFQACTNLTEVPKDALTPNNAFKTDQEILAGVASVYAGLRSTLDDYYNLSEITTDELIVPTRGNDWYDNGRWLEIHRQQWGANSGSGLADVNGTWNALFSGVAKANLMIEVMNQSTSASKDVTLAELRTLRAWYYYLLMDSFGRVPLVTTTQLAQNAQVSRDSLFRFVESELNAARTVLPKSWPASGRGRVTSGSADAILASLYLNAQVFTGTVSASALTKGTARWADAITAADRVINSGQYSLATDWKKNFSIDNHDSPEHVFWVAESSAPDLGMNFQMRALHYNMLSPEPWNGFATLAETYRAFDPSDDRRNVFLVGGPQKSYNTGQPVTDRSGKPLVFTDTIGDATKAAENEGARLVKFPPLPGASTGSSHPNNFPIFRLAEMYLIKAEAMNELGQTAAGIAQANIVRSRHLPAGSLLNAGLSQGAARTAIFNERLFELAGEAKRRQDMIRAGTYLAQRPMCSAPIAGCVKAAQPGFRILFPIPETQLQSNPKLTQNPGY